MTCENGAGMTKGRRREKETAKQFLLEAGECVILRTSPPVIPVLSSHLVIPVLSSHLVIPVLSSHLVIPVSLLIVIPVKTGI